MLQGARDICFRPFHWSIIGNPSPGPNYQKPFDINTDKSIQPSSIQSWLIGTFANVKVLIVLWNMIFSYCEKQS